MPDAEACLDELCKILEKRHPEDKTSIQKVLKESLKDSLFEPLKGKINSLIKKTRSPAEQSG